jgi:hypothetical protein
MSSEFLVGLLSVVATIVAALIQRTWTWTWRRRRFLRRDHPLSYGSVHEENGFSVLDLVKILDLRESPGPEGARTGRGILTDSYLVKRESDEGNGLVCLYSTSGELAGASISHPHDYAWGTYDSGHMNVNKVLAVPLQNLAEGSVTRLASRLVYTGAFDRREIENFETHIERPTRSLTFILLFSPGYRCVSASGKIQIGGRSRRQSTTEGRILIAQEGTLLYWRLTPEKGEWLPYDARYQIEWQWRETPVPAPRQDVADPSTAGA